MRFFLATIIIMAILRACWDPHVEDWDWPECMKPSPRPVYIPSANDA